MGGLGSWSSYLVTKSTHIIHMINAFLDKWGSSKRYAIKRSYTHRQILAIRPHRPSPSPSRHIPTVHKAVYSRCTCSSYIIGIIRQFPDPFYSFHSCLLAHTTFPAFHLHSSLQNQLCTGGWLLNPWHDRWYLRAMHQNLTYSHTWMCCETHLEPALCTNNHFFHSQLILTVSLCTAKCIYFYVKALWLMWMLGTTRQQWNLRIVVKLWEGGMIIAGFIMVVGVRLWLWTDT